jgi:hypothetical protein
VIQRTIPLRRGHISPEAVAEQTGLDLACVTRLIISRVIASKQYISGPNWQREYAYGVPISELERIKVLRRRLSLPGKRDLPDEWPVPDGAQAGVYVLAMERWTKIGQSEFLARRLAALYGSLPLRPRLVTVYSTDRPKELEATLHAMFVRQRSNGEWFELVAKDARFLRLLGEAMQVYPLRIVAPRRDTRKCWFEGATEQYDTLGAAVEVMRLRLGLQ